MNSEQLARRIIDTLRAAGHSAFFVGGCVRDLLLHRAPKDYDVATSARPEELLRLFPRAGQVGAHFGVVLVHEDRAHVEVATYRSDLEYLDGRRPEAVRFETDPRADALRRDFTINALFMDPVSGKITDYCGGQTDLRAGVIRAIGDPGLRFAEDHLRLLRAIRFAARLGFEIEPATFDGICRLAPQIQTVSAERVRDEISRILTEGGARRGFGLMDSTGLLHHILPEIEAMKGVGQPPEYHPEGDVWTHTMIMLEGLRNPSLELALGVLLHDVGKPGTFRIAERIRFDGHVELGVTLTQALLTRLRFSKDTIEAVEALVANHMKFRDVPKMRESRLKRFLRLPHFDDHMELHRLDCSSSHGGLDNYRFVQQKLAEVPPEALKPPALITGRDLIAAGFRPGPAFGVVLTEVEDAQLEGSVRNRDEALALASSRLRSLAWEKDLYRWP